MEFGLLFLAIVVFSLWYDNLCLYETQNNYNFWLVHTKDSIKKDSNCNIH